MAVTTQSGSPNIIEAGDTYIFTENFVDFPNRDWTARYLLQIPGSAAYSTNATNGSTANTFLFTINAANTANWTPGRYDFSIYCTEIAATSQRATAKTGVVQVLPDLTQTQALSSAATMLVNIETAITSLTTGGFQSVSVNNVTYTRYDVATLISMRMRLQAEVIRERQAADAFRGIESSGLIATRFKVD